MPNLLLVGYSTRPNISCGKFYMLLPPLIDIGANLTHESFNPDRDSVIQGAHDAGVVQMVVTGASLEGSQAALTLSRERPGVLYATAGVHPHHAKDWDESYTQILTELSTASEVVASGECGLDYFRNFSTPKQQKSVFEAQLDIAVETQLPLFLHQRDSIEPFLEILDPYLAKISRAVAHCFTGTADELELLLERDLYIGITGWICDERRGHHLRDIVSMIPENRLMIETDAPYLLPRDLKPKPKSRRNLPQYLPHINQTIAKCLNVEPDELAIRTSTNAQRFFDLKPR